MRTKVFILLSLVSVVILTACEQGPGEGGTSTIRGRVIEIDYNADFTIPRDTFPAAKEDVYIIYGDEFVYGDRFETSMDGTYEFKYLREGSYTIFAYSDDSTPPFTDEKIPVTQQVEITGKDQIVEVPDIIILK